MYSKIAIATLSAALVLILLAFTSIAQSPEDLTADPNLETANKVKDYYADWLSSIPGVSAVTVANSNHGFPEIRVEVEQMTPQLKEIPDKLNGIPVVVTPSKEAGGGSLPSSEPVGTSGFMPTPTPEIEISPVPTPQGNPFFPERQKPNAFPSP